MLNKTLCTVVIASCMLSTPVCVNAESITNTVQSNIMHAGFADLVAKVKPAVVSVQVRSRKSEYENDFLSFFDLPDLDNIPENNAIKRFFKDFNENFTHENKNKKQGHLHLVAQGSGFFISKDGYIVTNNHLVKDGEIFSITMDDGTDYSAKLIGTDARTDIAVLKAETKTNNFPFVSFGNDNNVRIGDWVVAVGNPFGLGGTVTAGIISARGRDIGASVYDDFLQIDAAVNRGNSGGPTFNTQGEVVGINTAIYSPSGGSVGIAFAIPSLTAKTVVEQLIAKGSVERGWLGVETQEITKEIAESINLANQNGVLVAQTLENSAAEKFGIKTGDIILAVNNDIVKNPRDFAKKIAYLKPKQKVALTILRNNKKEIINVILAAMPEANKESIIKNNKKSENPSIETQLGLNLKKTSKGNGLIITHVNSDSEAAYKGLSEGMVIKSVNNIIVNDITQFTKIVEQAKLQKRQSLLLQIYYNNHNSFVALPLK